MKRKIAISIFKIDVTSNAFLIPILSYILEPIKGERKSVNANVNPYRSFTLSFS